uniref:RanBP2-type domain-containing protein n=1 Tax=Branchiostoma floridae TaxID=7739 RepID=C3ZAE3_BRAFL|eukprot:XP_002594525.1 hypothetical protein BRAFLDRAFT_87748 [Branchiostoma floridae]
MALVPSLLVLLLVFCYLLQDHFTSGIPTSTPGFCPESQAWDPHLKTCVSCALCKGYPETPVCASCQSLIDTQRDDPQKLSVPSAAHKLEACENGYAWDSVQNKCFWCGVCNTYPDTPFCDQCADETTTSGTPPPCPEGSIWDGFLDAPEGSRPDHNTVLVAVLTTAAIVLAMCLAVAVWASRGPDRGVCRLCGHGQQRPQFPEVEPGKTVKGYKLTQVEDDSGCSSMGSSNTSIVLLTTDKVTVV